MESVDAHIDRAWRAREDLRRMPQEERVRRVQMWADIFRSNRQDLITLAVEKARSIKKWAVSQVDDVISFCERYPERIRPLQAEEVHAAAGKASIVFEPYGVVGLVAPRNSPYRPLFYSLADSLASGNSIVVGPSSAIREAAEESVRLVSDGWGDAIQVTKARGKAVAEAFTSSPKISVIKLYGNFRTGARFLKKHAEALSTDDTPTSNVGMRRLKTFVMELSGNDPLVVLPDCNVEEAVSATIQGSFLNSGQVCLCAKRIIVHRDVADDFIHQLVTGIARLRVGPLDDMDTDIGPLIDEAALTRVLEQLDSARRAGGTVLCGGRREGEALQPTLVRFDKEQLAPGGSRPSLWFDECFGPARGIVVVDSLQEARSLAADTRQGLGATLFGRPDDCQWLARELQVGRVVINRNPAELMGTMLPFGGTKDSGLTGAEYPIEMLNYRKLLVQ